MARSPRDDEWVAKIATHVGARIKELRIARGLATPYGLATAAGLNYNSLCAWEAGTRPAPLPALLRLTVFFGFRSIDELLAGTGHLSELPDHASVGTYRLLCAAGEPPAAEPTRGQP